MNFIKHFKGAMEKIAGESRLHATHVSLYMALFALWNHNRFENPISINRQEVMALSKIGSKHTYHKCLKELASWGFIRYEPSHNPMKGSLIYLFNFGTTGDPTTEQALNHSRGKNGTSSEQVLHPSLNYNKQLNRKHINSNHSKKNYDEPL